MNPERPVRLKFPCTFPLKVIGRDTPDFEKTVVEIIRRHVPELRDEDVSTRPSSRAKYLAVSVTFIASSQEQLDALYRELGAYEHVLMLL